MTAQAVTLRRHSWKTDSTITVTLTPSGSESRSRWSAVYDGHHLGYVERYTGTLDRLIPNGGRHCA